MRDADSFDAFYAATVQRVTVHLYAMTARRSEAEDCIQEACPRQGRLERAWPRRLRRQRRLLGDRRLGRQSPEGRDTDRALERVSVVDNAISHQ